jgi:hypothetical protein
METIVWLLWSLPAKEIRHYLFATTAAAAASIIVVFPRET